MATQKFTSFDVFFKCTLIWQLSQYNLTKLFWMKLKQLSHSRAILRGKMNFLVNPMCVCVCKYTCTGELYRVMLRFIALCRCCVFADWKSVEAHVEQACRCHLSNSSCSLGVSGSHSGNSCNILNNPNNEKTVTHWRYRWWLAFFSKKVVFN